MSPRTTQAWAALASVLVIAGSARAQSETPSSPLNFSLGAASDYVFRGVSQTRRRPNLFAGADLDIGAVGYAGGWVSNVALSSGARTEFDISGGVRPVIGPVTVDLGFVRYGFTGGDRGQSVDFTEWKLAPSMALGPATLGLALFHGDRFFGARGATTYYEVNAATPLRSSAFILSGALGRQQAPNTTGYTIWNLGIGYALNDRLGLDVRYWDTTAHGRNADAGARLVVGVKAAVP